MADGRLGFGFGTSIWVFGHRPLDITLRGSSVLASRDFGAQNLDFRI